MKQYHFQFAAKVDPHGDWVKVEDAREAVDQARQEGLHDAQGARDEDLTKWYNSGYAAGLADGKKACKDWL